jgi:hypothetical protein
MEPIKHALNVSTAVSTHNYHSLFQLYLKAPNMGAYIMDFFIPRCRVQALIIMCKAYVLLIFLSYRPLLTWVDPNRYSLGIPISFVAEELAFDNGVEELHGFLVAEGAAFYINPNLPIKERVLDSKTAMPALKTVFGEKHSRVGIKGAI